MQRLRTTIQIPFNDTDHSSKTDKIIGEIKEVYRSVESNETIITYLYYSEIEGIEILRDTYAVTEIEADALHAAVKDDLPDADAVGYTAWNDALMLQAMKYKFVEKFIKNEPTLTVAQIEIID